MPTEKRRSTRVISVGNVKIGGANDIVVQSMTNTDTRRTDETLKQIDGLEKAGCRLVRVAVRDKDAVSALTEIVKYAKVPIISDIHFDYRLALSSIDRGASGIRINPGNIKQKGGKKGLLEIIRKASQEKVAVRVGINSGSLEKDLLKKYGGPTPDAMVESTINSVRLFEEHDCINIKLSLKSTNVLDTIRAYRAASERLDYPLHVGITEAGTPFTGAVKSAVGIGILLNEGIGDTIRVSLAGDPVKEVSAAYTILKALGMAPPGPEVIACPTCGRTEIDIATIAEEVERRLAGFELPITVAIMGCEVNGPGEAREADLGIAGGKKNGLLFKGGKVIRKVKEGEIIDALMGEVEKLREESQ